MSEEATKLMHYAVETVSSNDIRYCADISRCVAQIVPKFSHLKPECSGSTTVTTQSSTAINSSLNGADDDGFTAQFAD